MSKSRNLRMRIMSFISRYFDTPTNDDSSLEILFSMFRNHQGKETLWSFWLDYRF